MPRRARKPTYADLVAKLAKAQAKVARAQAEYNAAKFAMAEASGREARFAQARLAKARAKLSTAPTFGELDALRHQIDAMKAAEMANYPEQFRKSDEEKARLFRLGWLEGGQKALVRHLYPPPESFLMEECVRSLAALLRREGGPPADILSEVASLLDDSLPLAAQMPFVARIQQRSAGAIKNLYAIEQIVAAVAAYERKGKGEANLGREAAVNEVAERYGIDREYVYECLRHAPPTPVIPPRKRPSSSK